MAALFLGAGIILALVGRRWNLAELAYHEHLLAVAAVVRTLTYNNHAPGYFGYLSVRIVTVCVVAAGLYAISRKATLKGARHALPSAYLHTTAATSLLALLMWYEATGWLAVFWAVFAFVLAAIDRRFEFDDLRWQAHALSTITMIRCVAFNMYVEDNWHGVSLRLPLDLHRGCHFLCDVSAHPNAGRVARSRLPSQLLLVRLFARLSAALA